jgi:hypothetical protein
MNKEVGHTHTWKEEKLDGISIEEVIRKSESELLYYWRFTANHFILALRPLRHLARMFLSIEHLRSWSLYKSSLTRAWVWHLQLMLGLSNAFILGFQSRGTCDHILLSPRTTHRATVEVFDPATTSEVFSNNCNIIKWQEYVSQKGQEENDLMFEDGTG